MLAGEGAAHPIANEPVFEILSLAGNESKDLLSADSFDSGLTCKLIQKIINSK